MVGAALTRLCSAYGDPQSIALASVSLNDLLEFPAEQPGQAEERDQHDDAQTRRGIVHRRLRELTEGIAGRDGGAGPQACRDKVEREERGPGQPRCTPTSAIGHRDGGIRLLSKAFVDSIPSGWV